MNEEKFNPNAADGDTMLIVARLERERGSWSVWQKWSTVWHDALQ